MPDVRTLLINLNRQGAAKLEKAARELGDRITWRPLDKGRSALNQVVECGAINLLGAQLLEKQAVPPFDPAMFERTYAENDTPEKAFALLAQGTDALVKAIEAFPEEKWEEKVTLPFGGGMEMSFAEVALLNYWNMTYHEGQVNYIQTLCAE